MVLRIEVASVPTISNNVLQFLVSVLHLSNTFLIGATFWISVSISCAYYQLANRMEY